MERKVAETVVRELNKSKVSLLTVQEAMTMTKIQSDGYEVYAIQKGDITFFAWIKDGNCVKARYVFW